MKRISLNSIDDLPVRLLGVKRFEDLVQNYAQDGTFEICIGLIVVVHFFLRQFCKFVRDSDWEL